MVGACKLALSHLDASIIVTKFAKLFVNNSWILLDPNEHAYYMIDQASTELFINNMLITYQFISSNMFQHNADALFFNGVDGCLFIFWERMSHWKLVLMFFSKFLSYSKLHIRIWNILISISIPYATSDPESIRPDSFATSSSPPSHATCQSALVSSCATCFRSLRSCCQPFPVSFLVPSSTQNLTRVL